MFGVTFHPKIYLLRWSNRAQIIVGSNNLTEGGWYRNYEASALVEYLLPADEASFETAQIQLTRFLKPKGPVATLLTPSYLASLLALPEIPSETTAKRIRAEGIPKRPPSGVFGYESIPPIPKGPTKSVLKVVADITSGVIPVSVANSPKVVAAKKTDSFVIQIRAHHNGEIFLSVTAALQNPAFFKWPFNGLATPKKVGNPAYPQIVPDPVVDIVVFGATAEPVLILQGYSLNTVYYSKKSEIRITASPLVGVMTDSSVMIMRRSETLGRDYDIAIHRTDSSDYQDWLDACDQTMPGGGGIGRKFGWF
jgi:hypothetical protein